MQAARAAILKVPLARRPASQIWDVIGHVGGMIRHSQMTQQLDKGCEVHVLKGWAACTESMDGPYTCCMASWDDSMCAQAVLGEAAVRLQSVLSMTTHGTKCAYLMPCAGAECQ